MNSETKTPTTEVPSTRETWVKPAIESFAPVSATESITSTNPGDIINSNS